MSVLKVIVSNESALEGLYGKRGAASVEQALENLIKVDTKRGMATEIVYLDNVEQMSGLNAPPVANPDDDRQNKAAIDAVYATLKPDYLVILGAPDIVPMQRLDNPMTGDADADVPSDLPYACSGAYSRKILDFLNPTRVVGRLAGITGNKNPDALNRAISAAAIIEPKPRSSYETYLAISAKKWRNSSATSTQNIFGNADTLQLSPPSGPDWSNTQLDCLSHFVNCHGANNSPRWYGQDGNQYPEAMTASQIDNKLRIGTIAAAECCYGAQLYPAPEGTQFGICNTYLANGAATFCGSSTIAYGPADGQGQADLITQYFLINLLGGASAGRAMLEARQKFIQTASPLGPSDLKTLAQFNVMGDTACQPVAAPMSAIGPVRPDVSQAEVHAMEVALRRRRLQWMGDWLGRSARWLEPFSPTTTSSAVQESLEELAQRANIVDWTHQVYRETGGEAGGYPLERNESSPVIHILFGKQAGDAPGPNFAVVKAYEISGRLVAFEVQYTKGNGS